MDLKTAKVLVTGGSSGIGYATAQLLRDKGADVAHEQEQAQADLCAAGDSCAPTVATEEPAAYATPVEVDCRAMLQEFFRQRRSAGDS